MPANQAKPKNSTFTPYLEKKGEEYMNSAQLDHFKAILFSWKKELMEEVDRDKTLDRIEDDDYGFCDSCGVEIGVRRLEARPTATLCIDCKTLAEIKERQTGI